MFAQLAIVAFEFSFASNKFGVERAFTGMQCTHRGLMLEHCEATLLAARFGLLQTRADAFKFCCQRSRPLFGRLAYAVRGCKFALKFRQSLAFASQTLFDVLQRVGQRAKIGFELSTALVD